MWKFVTRGIRETLERRASCRTNVYSQTSADSGGTNSEVKTNLAKDRKILAPSVATCDNGFFSSSKSGGPKDKKYDSEWDTRRSWSEAVGWSSVLAIGWVVCQSVCLRRRLFERSSEDKWHNRLLRFHGVRVPVSFVDAFNLSPQHVLPVTDCVANQTNGRQDRSSQEWSEQRVYGPITIEEALKEAKDDYTRTHRYVMGEFELRFGVKALEEKRYKDAVKHFATGANLSSSGSMFNLGLCHELGIGTATNLMKAAKYYREAADRGHPDAMYNLGVFHAQGRGGLTLDVGKARQLFTEAANLGQIQARVALDVENNVSDFLKQEDTAERIETNRQSEETLHDKRKKTSKALLQLSGFRDSMNEESLEESSLESSYGDVSFEAVKNPTDLFLNSLGIETNPMPILVDSSHANVSCYS